MTLARRVAALEERCRPAEPRIEWLVGKSLTPESIDLTDRIHMAREAGGPDAEARVAAIMAEPGTALVLAGMAARLREAEACG